MKKTIAAPVSKPFMPFGKIGFQFSTWMWVEPTAMNNRITVTLKITIKLLALVPSFTPRTSSHVSAIRIRKDARLIWGVITPFWMVGCEITSGSRQPKRSSTSFICAAKPTATAMFDTAYSSTNCQPTIQAKISPSVA